MSAPAQAMQASDFERPLWRDLTPWRAREPAGRSQAEEDYRNARAASDPAEAIRLLQQAAESGHRDAAFHLGLALQLGTGVEANYREAARWYGQAYERGSVAAFVNLLKLERFEDDWTAEANVDVSWLRPRAEAGDVVAQFVMGICCGLGVAGATEDAAEAVRWYRLAADQGFAPAQCNLADKLEHGTGVAQDLREAARLYRAAADAGVAAASFALGEMLRDGRGVRRSETEAAESLRKALEAGYADARPALRALACSAWQRGQALAARIREGQAADTLPPAEEIYEIASEVDNDRVEGGAELAFALYLQAGRLGHSESQLQVGFHYLRGIGVQQDATSALAWYLKSAEQGNVNAFSDLGRMYEEGDGVVADAAQSQAWYRKAAGQGDILAREKLGQPLGEMINFRLGIALQPAVPEGEPVPEEHEYGELNAIYRDALGLTIVASLFLGAMAAMVLLVDGGPRSFGLFLLGVIAFLWARSFLYRVEVYTYALVRRNIFGKRVLRLAPGTHYHYRSVRETDARAPRSDLAYVLVDDGETRLRLGGNLELFQDLHVLLQAAEERDFLSRASVRYHGGETLDFGVLRLAQGRMRAGNRSLKLEQVSSVTASRRHLRICGPGGKVFLHAPLVQIPNVLSLLGLLESLTPMGVAELAPPGAGPEAVDFSSWLTKVLLGFLALLMLLPFLAGAGRVSWPFALIGLACAAVLARKQWRQRVPPHAPILRD